MGEKMKIRDKIKKRLMNILITIMLLSFFVFAYNIEIGHAIEGDYIDSWDLTGENNNPYGMTTDGTNIWVVDSDVDKVYKYDMAGGYIGVWSLTGANTDPTGITTDGTNIWVVDSDDDNVYKYDMAGGYIGVWSLTGENDLPNGITTDGTNIWVVDNHVDKVYKYDMAGGYVDSWALTGGNDLPTGITTDGTNIWVVDSDDDNVYKYDMAGGYIGVWSLTGENDRPYGITTDGTNIWVVDETDDKVYKYALLSAPTQSGEVPANSSIGISLTLDLYVLCSDDDADNMNATWWSNSSSSWVQFASNWTSFPSGTNITQSNSNFSVRNTTYWWSVNLTDGTYWTNNTYHFTTGGVITNNATNVEETTATLSGSIIGSNGMTCGFWYNTSTTSSSDFGNNVTVSGTFDDGETFTKAVTGLTSGDYYYVRAWNYKSGIDFFNSTNETYFLTKPYAPFNVSASISENNISITWDNATINVTNRTNHVRYKTTGYPTSVTDGTLLYNDSTINVTMVYWYTPGVTYYFSIWTYINESGSPSLFQFSSSSNNSNILGSTKPTNLAVTD